MKAIIIFFAILLCTTSIFAQDEPTGFEGHHKNIYIELLGSHLLAGINFDMRLNEGQMDGIGFRAGIGGISASTIDQHNDFTLGIVTFPLEFNHVLGERRSSLITGVGLLPIYATLSGKGELSDHKYVRGEGFGLAGGFLTFGYRLQPLNRGFMMQINWNPMILRGSGFSPGWIGLGLGAGFK